MKKRLVILSLVAALFVGFAAEDKARANSAVSFNLFYSSLTPYGNWVPMDYGYGWSPAGVGAGWRPYMDGQWVWSDLGWTWASYEPWGWATYHYGRWVMDPYYGWLWIPGTTWAPAWVSWYQTPGYVGWSPLPPDNNFFLSIGFNFFSGGYYGGYNYYGYRHGHKNKHRHGHKHRHHDKGRYYDNDHYAPGEHCVFVPEDKFGHKNSKLVAVDIDKNRDLVTNRDTRNVTDIRVDNDKVYNLGPDKNVLERQGRAKIEQVSLVDTDLSTLRSRADRGTVRDGKFDVYRPRVERKEGETPSSVQPARNASLNGRNTAEGNRDRGSLSTGANPSQGLRHGTADRNNITGGTRNPVDRSALGGSAGPEEYGVIRKSGNSPNDTQTGRGPASLGSTAGRMPGNTPGNEGMTVTRPGADTRSGQGPGGDFNPGQGPEAPNINRPQNQNTGANRPTVSRPQSYGPGGDTPTMTRPGSSGPSVNRQPANRSPNYSPGANAPSAVRPQGYRPGGDSPTVTRPQSYSPAVNSPASNRQPNSAPSVNVNRPSAGSPRNSSPAAVSRPAVNNAPAYRPGGSGNVRAPQRQSAPAPARNTNAVSRPQPNYNAGSKAAAPSGGQSAQPRSYSQPAGNARSGNTSGGSSRQSYDRAPSQSSGGAVRSAPSGLRSPGGGSSINRSSVRGR